MELKKLNCKDDNLIGAGIAFIAVIFFSVFVYNSEYLYTHDTFSISMYKLMVTALVLFLGCYFLYMKSKKTTTEVATFIAIICMGCIANIIFTPFSVPDEYIHYYSAYHVSNQILFRFDDITAVLSMRGDDAVFAQNMHLLNKSQYLKLLDEFSVFSKNSELVQISCGYIANKFFLYFPAAVGVTIGRLLNLSSYLTFTLGRLGNLLFFALGMYFAMRMMPFGKQAVAGIALLPMSLHIATSFSYDVFSTVGVMLIFAYIMHIMYGEDKIGWLQVCIMGAMIAFVIPHKVVYIGVAAIVLVIPREQFKKPELHFIIKCALGIVGVLSIFVMQFANTTRLVGNAEISTTIGYTIPYILDNFSEFTRMMLKSTIHFADYYLKGMIAYFGWFQIEMPWFLTIFVLLFLILSFMKMRGEPKAISGIERVYALLLFLAIYAITLLLLLIDHTPMGSEVILGVQGRYFITALPLIYLSIRNNSIVLEPNADKMIVFGMVCSDALIFIYTLARVFAQ